MSTAVDVSGEIDSPPVETKNEKSLQMASWTNLSLTGNLRDVVTQQVLLRLIMLYLQNNKDRRV